MACGLIRLNGKTIWPGGVWQPHRAIQLVRQDQDSPLAFNPRWRISELMEEPLLFAEAPLAAPARRARVAQWAESAGLDARALPRTASEISRGQRQRVARALALAVQELDYSFWTNRYPGWIPRRPVRSRRWCWTNSARAGLRCCTSRMIWRGWARLPPQWP